MTIPCPLERLRAIRTTRAALERNEFPRLQMSLLVGLTGAAGFVASFLFLHAGMSTMWIRYLAAFGVAYLVFLFLLWLWLRTRADDYLEAADIVDALPLPSGPGGSVPSFGGKGGQFDGGGASGSFDGAPEPASGIGEVLGGAAEADEFAIPLLLLALVGALLLSSVFMIYSAPALFAELLVDAALSASLYRRLRGLQASHWLEAALRRTVWPFALTAALVSAAGWAMAVYAPGAHSIGEVMSAN